MGVVVDKKGKTNDTCDSAVQAGGTFPLVLEYIDALIMPKLFAPLLRTVVCYTTFSIASGNQQSLFAMCIATSRNPGVVLIWVQVGPKV